VVVTSHDGKGPHSKERYRSQILPRVAVLEVPTPLAVTHVQPLPGGKMRPRTQAARIARSQASVRDDAFDSSERTVGSRPPSGLGTMCEQQVM
jgi:hypothetical protein